MRREWTFLLALWKANLLSAMEYRAAFLTQMIGMMLNNGVYFLFWVIFFDRFREVRGWGLNEMLLLFGVVASSVGLTNYLFGNVLNLGEIIASGRLDYYLSQPRPVLLHVLASRSHPHGVGDFLYGLISFLLAGAYTPTAFLRFLLGVILAMTVFLSFLILVQSLAFWMGNAELLAGQALNAITTLSIYPIALFDGTSKLLLFTVLPAAFVGAVPAEFIAGFTWQRLLLLVFAGAAFLSLALYTFHRGLQHYESGSAIQVQL